MVLALQAKLKAKSKVEVVQARPECCCGRPRSARRLREAYRRASRATRASLSQELAELDHLAGEGLSES